jgi:prevent-host-death family protein
MAAMQSYNVAEAKTRFSEILERVAQGEEVLLTKRGRPVARVIPAAPRTTILGAGQHDPNINRDVIARDDWWKPLRDDEERVWYE